MRVVGAGMEKGAILSGALSSLASWNSYASITLSRLALQRAMNADRISMWMPRNAVASQELPKFLVWLKGSSMHKLHRPPGVPGPQFFSVRGMGFPLRTHTTYFS
jgi:hypothetical protein